MSQQQHIVKPMIFLVGIWILVCIHILAANTDVPAYFQLFLQSIICVYLGCFYASKVSQQKNSEIVSRATKDSDSEQMSSKDAYMFPVYGSITLFSIYACYKFLPPQYLNIIFTIHFTFIGMLALAGFLEFPVMKYLGKPAWETIIVLDFKLPINLGFWKKEIDIKINYLEAICLSIAVGPTIIYGYSKNWITNNIFGIAFSITGIENLSLPNFKTGFILLWGLFFYDIFWVYGTDVMVTVAKNFDVPIKLIFPYQWHPDGENAQPKFSMLGLGDIVIPGIFVALCLKYDLDKQLKKVANVHSVKTPLFNFCFGGYILGIIVTYAVMVIFQHPQPALLFLVPGCTGAVLVYALMFGKLKELFSYEEENGRLTDEQKQQKNLKDVSKEELNGEIKDEATKTENEKKNS